MEIFGLPVWYGEFMQGNLLVFAFSQDEVRQKLVKVYCNCRIVNRIVQFQCYMHFGYLVRSAESFALSAPIVFLNDSTSYRPGRANY